MSGFWKEIGERLAGKPIHRGPTDNQIRSATDSHLIVGLDFGTSGSKVVVRDAMRQREEPIAIDFGTPADLGFNRFVFPSTVAIRDGILRFGSEAEYAASHTHDVFRSLKRDFLRNSGLDAAHDREIRDPTLIALNRDGLVGEFLVTLYLAEILRRTWEALSIYRNDFSPADADINLDVPIASLSRAGAGSTFLRMLRIARQLSTRVAPNSTTAELCNLWDQAGRSLPEPLAPAERLENVVPEAVAAIGGLGEAAHRSVASTNWVVVDVGAGTTDIGFFRYPDRDGRRAVFFSAKTSVLGCDDVDLAICRILGKGTPTVEELAAVRLAKTKVGAHGVPVFDGVLLNSEHVEEAVLTIQTPAATGWARAFGEAYKRDMGEDRWHRLTVFVVGGGSLTPGIRRIYEWPPHPIVRDVNMRKINRNVTLGSAGAGNAPPSEADLIFLLAALGLSLPPTERPKMVHPEDVPPSSPPPQGPTGNYDFDADDMFSG